VAPGKTEAASAAKVRWLEAVMDQAQAGDGKSPAALTLQFAGGARAEIADLSKSSWRRRYCAPWSPRGQPPHAELHRSLKVLLAVEPCDLRKSFNGLHGLVTERLGEDPRQGALFVFTSQAKPVVQRLERAFIRLRSAIAICPRACSVKPLGQWPLLTIFLENGPKVLRTAPCVVRVLRVNTSVDFTGHGARARVVTAGPAWLNGR
jgi:hypothetical protein